MTANQQLDMTRKALCWALTNTKLLVYDSIILSLSPLSRVCSSYLGIQAAGKISKGGGGGVIHAKTRQDLFYYKKGQTKN